MRNTANLIVVQIASALVQFVTLAFLVRKAEAESFATISYAVYSSSLIASIVNLGIGTNWAKFINLGLHHRVKNLIEFQIVFTAVACLIYSLVTEISLVYFAFLFLFSFSLQLNIPNLVVSLDKIQQFIILLIISRLAQIYLVFMNFATTETMIGVYFLLGSGLPAVYLFFCIETGAGERRPFWSYKRKVLYVYQQIKISVLNNLIGSIGHLLILKYLSTLNALEIVEFTLMDRIRKFGQNLLKNLTFIKLKSNHTISKVQNIHVFKKDVKIYSLLFVSLYCLTILTYLNYKQYVYSYFGVSEHLPEHISFIIAFMGFIIPLSAWQYSNHIIVLNSQNSIVSYNKRLLFYGLILVGLLYFSEINTLLILMVFEVFSFIFGTYHLSNIRGVR